MSARRQDVIEAVYLRGMRALALRLCLFMTSALSASCGPNEPACEVLFGQPNERTGLDETRCQPVCEGCGSERFVPRVWDDTSLTALRSFELTEAPELLTSTPYDTTPATPQPGAVCAVVVEDVASRRYHVETFASSAQAVAAGAVITHADACGLCSSLTDLAVYASHPDLTDPVRQCGIANIGRFDGLLSCLEALGFTRPCAQIWAYNTEHTRDACGATCVRLLRAPYHEEDGSLNECLACDERESGAVFKAIAGRTRRNSGLANAMCRPCSEVIPLAHDYPGL